MTTTSTHTAAHTALPNHAAKRADTAAVPCRTCDQDVIRVRGTADWRHATPAADPFALLSDGEVTGPGIVEDGAQTDAAAEAAPALDPAEQCEVCGGPHTGLYAYVTYGCDDLDCDSHRD